jgi:hypothetical protein
MLNDPPPDSKPPAPDAGASDGAAPSPAAARFLSCRWRHAGDDHLSPHCTHRDVLPMAGTNGFNAESWCPGCPHFKLRRSPRRPSYS